MAQEAAGELPAPGRLQREVIGARDGEEPPLERQEVGEDESEPHVRRGGQDVRERERGVVEHLAARGERADPVSRDVAEDDRRDEQGEGVRGRRPDQLAHRRADVGDALPEVAVEEATPEVEVLLPERPIEPERAGEVPLELLRGGGVGPQTRDEPLHRVAGHEPWDRPVDRHRDEERREVERELAGEVAGHAGSGVGSLERSLRLAARTALPKERCPSHGEGEGTTCATSSSA